MKSYVPTTWHKAITERPDWPEIEKGMKAALGHDWELVAIGTADARDIQEEKPLKIGDKAVCMVSGVCGIVVKIYTPTASAQQIMVRTNDGRLYHAPYNTWRKEV